MAVASAPLSRFPAPWNGQSAGTRLTYPGQLLREHSSIHLVRNLTFLRHQISGEQPMPVPLRNQTHRTSIATILVALAAITPDLALGQIVACNPGQPHPEAPAELSQFSFLLGRFDIKGRSWQGEAWSEGFTLAYWEGEYIMDGFAIADYWYNTPPDADGPAPGRGVNIRMYNETEGMWKMSWMHTNNPGVRMLEAQLRDGVMWMWQMTDPETRLPTRQVTFHVEDADHWYRIDEHTRDGGESWFKTLKLEASRRPCDG
jgi:hypothetical protein